MPGQVARGELAAWDSGPDAWERLLASLCFRANPSHQPAGMIRLEGESDYRLTVLHFARYVGLSCRQGSGAASRSGLPGPEELLRPRRPGSSRQEPRRWSGPAWRPCRCAGQHHRQGHRSHPGPTEHRNHPGPTERHSHPGPTEKPGRSDRPGQQCRRCRSRRTAAAIAVMAPQPLLLQDPLVGHGRMKHALQLAVQAVEVTAQPAEQTASLATSRHPYHMS